jgi:hypothetical protein
MEMTFTVILEAYNEECAKRVKIIASSAEIAMYCAMQKYPGWQAVGVE